MANRNNKKTETKRKSGCSAGVSVNKKKYVQGWMYTPATGLVKFYATQTKNTDSHKSKTSGIQWENWYVKMTFITQLRREETTGLYNPQTGSVHIDEFDLVMKPSTRGGGWVGNPN